MILLDAVPNVLGGFPASLGERAMHDLLGLGVEVELESPVIGVDPDGVVQAEHLLFDSVVEPHDGGLFPELSRPGIGLKLKTADAERYAAQQSPAGPGSPSTACRSWLSFYRAKRGSRWERGWGAVSLLGGGGHSVTSHLPVT